VSGYDRCNINVSFIVLTNYNGNDTPNVNTTCEAQLMYEDDMGIGGRKSADDSKSLYMYSQSQNDYLDISVRLSTEAVSVRLKEVSCRITNVF
jgi:hypothetical protein